MTITRRLAAKILNAVVHLASTGCKDWAEATRRELDFVENDWTALFWAVGCARIVFIRRDAPVADVSDIPQVAEGLTKKIRRRTRAGYVSTLIQIIAFGSFIFIYPNAIQRTGSALVVAVMGYIAYQLYAARPRNKLFEGDTSSWFASFRTELERQRDFHRGARHWSRLVLFVPGPILWCIGFSTAHPEIATPELPDRGFHNHCTYLGGTPKSKRSSELSTADQRTRRSSQGTTMKRIVLGLALGAIVLVQCTVAQSSMNSPVSPDSEIRKILVERIDKDRQSLGIVVGVIEATGRRIVAYGSMDKGDKRPLDGDTVFEIGSVTKVFTSLLLANMVQRGEVALTDPVAKYLPTGVKMPERGGRQITLQDLATHTSGLPRLPSNFTPKDPANPYADYTVEQLYEFLSSYQLTRDIGSQYEYSNLGGGLLGHVLALRAGMSYEQLLRSRILEPFGMNSTGITLTKDIKARLAAGHNQAQEKVANWDLPTLAGAGALRSTASDMLSFLAANLGYTKSALAPAMAAMLKVRRPTGMPGVEVALGWHISTRDGHEIIWHNGGTGGYRSFIGYDLERRVGVVALSNTETAAGVDDIGQHLLDTSVPLYQPPKERKEVAVDPKLFDGYVGRYQLTPNFILTVTREGNHLFTQATGQPKIEIFPESNRDYFLKVVDAQITFETDSQGRATGLILHQNGMNQPAKRIQ